MTPHLALGEDYSLDDGFCDSAFGCAQNDSISEVSRFLIGMKESLVLGLWSRFYSLGVACLNPSHKQGGMGNVIEKFQQHFSRG